MAGEIQIGGTTFATESGGTVTVSNVDTPTNRTNLGLGSMATQNANAVALTGGSITGTTIVPTTPFSFRNRIINGNLSNPINQRSAGSITESTGYTYDRWYYDGTNLYQGIEDKNVNDGTYVISWQGSGFNAYWKLSTDTTAYNGPDSTSGFSSALSSGDTFTVSGSGTGNHLWIKFSLDTALDFSTLDKVMVEEGTVATPFEHRSYGLELSLAQRYYTEVTSSSSGGYIIGHSPGMAWSSANTSGSQIMFPVEMRTAPSFTQSVGTPQLYSPSLGSFNATFNLENASNKGAAISTTGSSGLTTNHMYWLFEGSSAVGRLKFDAEL